MVLSINSEQAERLARDLAELTGESLTMDRAGQLPILDEREPEDIIGYDDHGFPS